MKRAGRCSQSDCPPSFPHPSPPLDGGKGAGPHFTFFRPRTSLPFTNCNSSPPFLPLTCCPPSLPRHLNTTWAKQVISHNTAWWHGLLLLLLLLPPPFPSDFILFMRLPFLPPFSSSSLSLYLSYLPWFFVNVSFREEQSKTCYTQFAIHFF